MDENKYLKRFTNCIPVKGAKRYLVCDAQRQKSQYISYEAYLLLTEFNGVKLSSIFKQWKSKYPIEEILELLTYLLEEEYVFLTNSPDNFPDMDLNFSYPFTVQNSIIDVDDNSSYSISKLLIELSENYVKFIQIRFFNHANFNDLKLILETCRKKKLFIQSIEILIPNSNVFTEENAQVLLSEYPRLTRLIVYNHSVNAFGNNNRLIFTKNNINNENQCGIISRNMFSMNIEHILEAKSCNTCLDKKISVDKYGAIKRCPSLSNSFGRVHENSLKEIVNSQEYKNDTINIEKDKIEKCKDCELRYICSDCRAYLEDPQNMYSAPLKCGYNPYTGNWEDWKTDPKKQEAIKYYNIK